MIPLLILGTTLVACWGFGMLERDGRARFMSDWVHVPLLAAIIVFLMAAGSIVKDVVQ